MGRYYTPMTLVDKVRCRDMQKCIIWHLSLTLKQVTGQNKTKEPLIKNRQNINHQAGVVPRAELLRQSFPL